MVWRPLVTDYPVIVPPDRYSKPPGLECRGDDEYVILWDEKRQKHVMMERERITVEGWKAALVNLGYEEWTK